MSTFSSKLGAICPTDDPRLELMVGPIKKPARIAVKVNEYKIENEGDLTKWPFICKARAARPSRLWFSRLKSARPPSHRWATCCA